MRHSIKMLLAVVLTVMSLAVVQTVWAEDEGWFVTGEISKIEPEISTITIIDSQTSEPISITGFPFGYLERELDIVFVEGNCVTVEYAIVICSRNVPVSKYIAVALVRYCENGGCDGDNCHDYNMVLRDDDFYPVDKSRFGDDNAQNHNRMSDGNGGPVPIPPGD